jgi:hypothetical protein
MNLIRSIVPKAIALGAAAFAFSASAALVEETANYGSANSPLTLGSSATLSLNQFNPSWGTLTSVTVTLFSYDTISSVVFSPSGQTASFTGASATFPVAVSLSDALGDLNNLTLRNNGTAGPFSGSLPGPGMIVAGSANLPEQSASITPTLAPYEGAGQFSFDVLVANSNGSYSGNGGSSLFFGGNAFSYGTVEVDYNYTPNPVPESGTLLSGLGLAGICVVGLTRRFRRIHFFPIRVK